MTLRGFWALMIVIFLSWLIVSHLYPDPSWWSIFHSNRSTHTPLIEHISLVKVTLVGVFFIGGFYLLRISRKSRK
ncbi:hypothetical protein E2626_11595 [Jeotgalibacillus salarius]|uniref:Uncharacterized protein n=1 Tax=Jeotgalibacillus salarius TaxID=546023 RepID=A0A4Y8LDS7_9BACL|nr:hypothetical protein E2626_11595 [Jeotgalibacillus salarius]